MRCQVRPGQTYTRTRRIHPQLVEALHISDQIWQLVCCDSPEPSKTFSIMRGATKLLILLHQAERRGDLLRGTIVAVIFLFNWGIPDKWLTILQILYTRVLSELGHWHFAVHSFLWRRANPTKVLLLAKRRWLEQRGKLTLLVVNSRLVITAAAHFGGLKLCRGRGRPCHIGIAEFVLRRYEFRHLYVTVVELNVVSVTAIFGGQYRLFQLRISLMRACVGIRI